MFTKRIIFLPLIALCLSGFGQSNNSVGMDKEVATFGAGCFWCVEAVFQELNGVSQVISGYSGGKIKNPTYREICSGLTGHAEVVQVYYDPKIISYSELLEVFWMTHDPTTLNQQGADRGTQYRSVIFYHSDGQQQAAQFYKQKLQDQKVFDRPIVTEISPYGAFYKAEDEHQDYYDENQNAPYCNYVIVPKLEKLRKAFAEKLKP